MGFTVSGIDKKSAAYKAGIRPGDVILGFEGEKFIDYIDYIHFSSFSNLHLQYRSNGAMKTVRIKKDADEPLGLDFAENLLKKRVCGNKCLFCFVDQLPKGMRRSLYVKDEDWRYSFVMGNYVTLSDISDDELERIIRRKASPLYISVHSADEEIRKQLLGNPKARPIRPLLEQLREGGISFHTQAVICEGVNDKSAYRETMAYLYSLYPFAQSLAAVPSGLTGHRQGLFPLKSLDAQTARQIVEDTEAFQRQAFKETDTRFAFASDEMYIRAGCELPSFDAYENFAQIENGVGLLRKLEREVTEAIEWYGSVKPRFKKVSAATGVDAYPFVKHYFQKIGAALGMEIMVYPVENLFFGKSITVSGLLTGGDICTGLAGRELGEALLLPGCMLKEREEVFLDDMTLGQIKEQLGVEVLTIPSDGYDIIEALITAQE
jgi:putative radical SAM enzyme (TIGR03279 family)